MRRATGAAQAVALLVAAVQTRSWAEDARVLSQAYSEREPEPCDTTDSYTKACDNDD